MGRHVRQGPPAGGGGDGGDDDKKFLEELERIGDDLQPLAQVIPLHRDSPRVPRKGAKPAFARLKACKCFQECHERMARGDAPGIVAKWLQEEQGEYKGVARQAVVRVLTAYRKALPPAQVLQEQKSLAKRKLIEQTIAKVGEGVDVLTGLQELYALQRERIELVVESELATAKLNQSTVHEIRVAGELLVRIAGVQMDLGIKTRRLGTLTVEGEKLAEVAARFSSPAVAEVVSDPKKRHKLLAVMERVLLVAGDAATAPQAAVLLEGALSQAREGGQASGRAGEEGAVEGQGEFVDAPEPAPVGGDE